MNAPQPIRMAGLTVSPLSPALRINLRGDAADRAWTASVAAVLGAALPEAPNGVAMLAQGWVAWLGPDEWLVSVREPSPILSALEAAAAPVAHAAVVDVSDGRDGLVLDGPLARALLARGTGIDLRPIAFAPGQAAQTVLGKLSVLLVATAAERVEVLVGRSFAPYLWRWTADAFDLIERTNIAVVE